VFDVGWKGWRVFRGDVAENECTEGVVFVRVCKIALVGFKFNTRAGQKRRKGQRLSDSSRNNEILH
jgi:hypothetical protein